MRVPGYECECPRERDRRSTSSARRLFWWQVIEHVFGVRTRLSKTISRIFSCKDSKDFSVRSKETQGTVYGRSSAGFSRGDNGSDRRSFRLPSNIGNKRKTQPNIGHATFQAVLTGNKLKWTCKMTLSKVKCWRSFDFAESHSAQSLAFVTRWNSLKCHARYDRKFRALKKCAVPPHLSI